MPDTASAPLYNSASATHNISETQATPTITWATPAAITCGAALGSAQLNETSSTAGTFSYTPAAGVVLSAGQSTLSVTFTPTDRVNYLSSTSSVSLTVDKAPLSISPNNASRIYGAANPAFSGAVNGSVNGDTFTEAFSTSASALRPSGTYAIVPSVSGADIADYTVSATNGTLTVAPAPTTTTFTLSSQNLTLTATVTSTSGVPTGPVVFYAGQTLLGTGTLNNGSANILSERRRFAQRAIWWGRQLCSVKLSIRSGAHTHSSQHVVDSLKQWHSYRHLQPRRSRRLLRATSAQAAGGLL